MKSCKTAKGALGKSEAPICARFVAVQWWLAAAFPQLEHRTFPDSWAGDGRGTTGSPEVLGCLGNRGSRQQRKGPAPVEGLGS